jgi:16S rRNA (guanine527-N7)-methyltransferase
MSLPQRQALRRSSLYEPALHDALPLMGLALNQRQVDQCLSYLALIAQWNQVYNLTALRDPAQMFSHHLLDSLACVAPLLNQLSNTSLAPTSTQPLAVRVLDVGSGAGLPGVVLALACPALQVVCVDAVAKKAAFIQQTAIDLKLPNLVGKHARVEQLQSAAPFDIVVSRAFASLPDFVTLTRQLVRGFHVKHSVRPEQDLAHPDPDSRPAGVWMALKGKRPNDEIGALPAWATVFHVEPLAVPGLDAERCIVWMRDNGQAPPPSAGRTQ